MNALHNSPDLRRLQFLGQPSREVASCHSLRHTFASNLLEQGAEIVSIRELLGHASITSSEQFARVSNQKVKQEYVCTMKKVLQHSKVREGVFRRPRK